MRVFAVLLSAALLAAGCSSNEATLDAKGEIDLEQKVIEFPRTFIGYPTQRELYVRNTGFTDIPIELALEGPFSMRSGRENVKGGAVLALPITFVPSSPRLYQGRVILTVEGAVHEVMLVAEAQTPPPCVPSAACRLVHFDPETGICHESVAPDLTACTTGNLCLENETCIGGSCVGAAVDCDAGSVCTADSCDPARGCINRDTTSSCPVPADPCKVAICDDIFGCAVADAPPGTSCGPATCAGAWLCVDGACDEYDVPDGEPCTAACGEGKCKAGECDRPQGDLLKLAWSYTPPDGRSLLFDGITDSAGLLYWIESRGAKLELVSFTTTGIERYRQVLGFDGSVGSRSLALEDELLLVAGLTEPVVEAHLLTDGSAPWQRDLDPEIRAVAADCPCGVVGGSITRSEPGRMLYAAELGATAQVAGSRTFLAMLRTGSGEVAWRKLLDGAPVVPPIADAEGNLYVLLGRQGPGGSAELIALDPAGEVRWRVPTDPEAVPLAVWDATVHQAIDALRSAADGSAGGALGYDAANAATPLHGNEGSWAFTMEPDGGVLARFFDDEGAPGPTIPLFEAIATGDVLRWSEPLLSWRDTAIVSTSRKSLTGDWLPLLLELQDDGEIRRTCELGINGPVEGVTSLRAERWVVQAEVGGVRQLRAYELPNGEPAARGWTGPAGGPAGGGHPR